MKFSLKFLILLSVLAIVSCSQKEDPLVPAVDPLSLILKSDAGEGDILAVGVNVPVIFTVMGSDGEDYTQTAKLFINDEEITGSTYEFSLPGEYSVKAKYDGAVSNTLTFDVLQPSERSLKLDATKAFRNQVVTFSLLDYQGNDTAENATFYVNREEISGNTFSSSTEGEFSVVAVYDIEGEEFTTEPKTFAVFIPKRKVVVEDYTGTWCGFCPGVAVAIEDLRLQTDDVAIVAIHKASAGVPDPLDFARVGELQEMFDVDNGFPKARINRKVDWPRPYALEQVTSMAGTDTDVSIAINSQLEGSNLSVKVKVAYENGSTTGDKVVVYLLENGVVADQANYFNETPGHKYQGLGNPIPDYIHNDGLRNALSNLFGDAIPDQPAFEVFEKDYAFSVPSNYVGENLSFVVMVVDSENNAKNAQYSNINENKDFE